MILVFLLLSLTCLTLAPPAHAETITLSSNPDCVSWGHDRIDCVARGTDNALWHTWWSSGSWNGWESFGGILTSGPSVTSSAPGRLDMFARGEDNSLLYIVWDGALHPSESIGGALTSDPDCISAVFGTIDCFVRGPDNALWHISFNGSWSKWESLGGILTSGPGAESILQQGVKAMAAFVRGADNAMWGIAWAEPWGNWSQWVSNGGILTSDPDAVGSMDPQDPSLFTYRCDWVVRGPNNWIWWKWWTVTAGTIKDSTGCQGCDGYESLGGVSNSGPTIASRGWNNLEVFTLGTDNKLYHKAWDGSTWSPWDAVPMTIALTTVTTSSTLAATSSESSSSSATTSATSMEESDMTTSSQSQPANTILGTADLTAMLQQNGVLIFGAIVLIVIVVLFASRTRHRRLESLKSQ